MFVFVKKFIRLNRPAFTVGDSTRSFAAKIQTAGSAPPNQPDGGRTPAPYPRKTQCSG